MNAFSFQLNYDEKSYTCMQYRGSVEDVVIPEMFLGKPVTILFDKLFSGHTEIRSVSIPDAVTDLGEFVFDGCARLHELKLPSGLRNLWGYTFCRSGLEEIVLPDSVKIIPPYAFKDCTQLRRVVCGSGMQKISAWAFGGCDKLTELVHAPDVEVSPQAFEQNTRILEIKYSWRQRTGSEEHAKPGIQKREAAAMKEKLVEMHDTLQARHADSDSPSK